MKAHDTAFWTRVRRPRRGWRWQWPRGNPSGRAGPPAVTSAGDPAAVESLRQALVRYGPARGDDAYGLRGSRRPARGLSSGTGVV